MNNVLTLVHNHTLLHPTDKLIILPLVHLHDGVMTLRTLFTFGTESLEGNNCKQVNIIASKCAVNRIILYSRLVVIHICG